MTTLAVVFFFFFFFQAEDGIRDKLVTGVQTCALPILMVAPMALRILLLEDVPADAALVERHLTKSGLEFVSQRVDTRARFEQALREFVPDIILSDHGLPGFEIGRAHV